MMPVSAPTVSEGAVSIGAVPSTRVARVDWGRVAVVVAAVVGVIPSTLGPFNHDVAWYLYGARRVMDGARLYVDIIDLNPPLVFYLGMPIEWVSRLAGWSEQIALAIAVALVTLWSTQLAVAVFRTRQAGPDVITGGVIAAWLFSVLILPGYDFGQREHWLVILLLPFCAASFAAAESEAPLPRGLALTIGALAGIAFAFKPYFLGALLVSWLPAALRRRSLRALLTLENFAIAGVLAAYLLFVLLVTPAYVRDMVPLARAQYWAFEMNRLTLLLSADVLLIAGGSVLIAAGGAALTGHRRGGMLAQQLAAVSLAFTAAFLVQGKGWYYQMLPAKAFAVMAAVVALVAFVQGRLERAGVPSGVRAHGILAWRAIGVGLCLMPALFFVIISSDYHVGALDREFERSRRPLLDVVRAKAAGRPIYVLSSSVAPAFPLVNQAGAAWPYHYHHFWPLPALYHRETASAAAAYRPPAAQSPIERVFFTTVVDDVIRTPPAVLVVDRSRSKQGFGQATFDYVAYFSQDAAFREWFRHYRRIAAMGSYDVYERLP